MILKLFPENKDEKNKYEKMRREWQEINGSGNFGNISKTKKKKCAKIVMTICSIIAVLFMLFEYKSNSFDSTETFSSAEISNDTITYSIQDNLAYDSHGYLPVSVTTSNYIQQKNTVINILNPIMDGFSSDFNNSLYPKYSYYQYDIDELLREIDVLRGMSVKRYSPFEEYQSQCESYFNCVYAYFSGLKSSQEFSISEYNYFCSKISSINTLHQCFIDIAEKYDIYYYIDDTDLLHYKFTNRYSLY